LTLATWITLVRCAGGPLIAYLVQFPQYRTPGAVIFVLLALTDWLDGFIARRTKTTTDLGKYLDPFADKVLVLSAFIALTFYQMVSLWGVLIITLRELSVMLLRIMAAEHKKKIIGASWSAKVKTVLQMTSVVFILMVWPYGQQVFWLAVVVTVYSFIEYVFVNKKVLS
jgi:CDP-diacylglycerol--glycerol-3-phosphate 3-phosphatidyltransferase